MSMSQYLKDRGGRQDETLTALATIELAGHNGCGASIDVEVTFTQTPIVKCSSFCRREDAFPDEGGEREFISLRVVDKDENTLDAPKWLLDLLGDCVDVDELNARED